MKRKLPHIIFLLIFALLAGWNVATADSSFSLIEEDRAFWDRVFSHEGIRNKNLLNAGRIAYENRMYELSMETLEECIKTNQNNNLATGVSHYYIGKNLILMGRYQDAITRFDRVLNTNLLAFDSVKNAIRLNKAIAYHNLRNVDKFKDILNDVILNSNDLHYSELALTMLSKIEPGAEKDYQGKIESIKKDSSTRGGIDITPTPSLDNFKKSPLRYTTFGFMVGQIMFTGKAKEVYNNTQYINPYILFTLTRVIGLSLNVEYISADSEGKDILYTSRKIWTSTLELNFFLGFADVKALRLCVSAGAGMARSTYTGLSSSSAENTTHWNSHDPYINLSAFINFEYGNLQFRFGAAYKRLYYYYYEEKDYEDTDLVMQAIFFGVGKKI